MKPSHRSRLAPGMTIVDGRFYFNAAATTLIGLEDGDGVELYDIHDILYIRKSDHPDALMVYAIKNSVVMRSKTLHTHYAHLIYIHMDIVPSAGGGYLLIKKIKQVQNILK